MKFKEGDKVTISNYGHLLWIYKAEQKAYFEAGMSESDKPKNIICETEDMYYFDLSPEKVGRRDIIVKAVTTQGKPQYSLALNGAWYNEDQLAGEEPIPTMLPSRIVWSEIKK